jgi:16S rRNA (uracil1498-N3)-methyltransferase
MHVFYDPQIGNPEAGEQITLNPDESRHCVKVLRLPEGSVVQVVNGYGGSFSAEIIAADPRATVLKLLSAVVAFQRRSHYLHIAVAPTKNIERMEWFLEKATEVGIDEVTPVICERSERKDVKMERLIKVMIAAMKQSQNAWLPKLNEPVKLMNFRADEAHQKFVAHCADGRKVFISAAACREGNYTILIGPEGDFSGKEIRWALEAGFVPVTLGESRLRTETAALAACFEINYMNRV